jgi:hypothetical protein
MPTFFINKLPLLSFSKGSSQLSGRKKQEQMRIERENEILKAKLSKHLTSKGKVVEKKLPLEDMQSNASLSSSSHRMFAAAASQQADAKEAKDKYDEFDKLLKMYNSLKGISLC